jgi:hypothetical protein
MIADLSAYVAILTQPHRCPTCNRLSTAEILTLNGTPTLLIRCPSRNQSRCVKRKERRTTGMCPAHYVALDETKGVDQ